MDQDGGLGGHPQWTRRCACMVSNPPPLNAADSGPSPGSQICTTEHGQETMLPIPSCESYGLLSTLAGRQLLGGTMEGSLEVTVRRGAKSNEVWTSLEYRIGREVVMCCSIQRGCVHTRGKIRVLRHDVYLL